MTMIIARRLALCTLPALALSACTGRPDLPPTPDSVPAPGLYQLPANAQPDAGLRFTLVTRGNAPSRGVLESNGQRLPIQVSGLLVQGSAPARVAIRGQLFGLERTTDFPGTYRPHGNSQISGGILQLGNDNLVVMRIWAEPALPLTLAPGGMTVTLGQ